MNCLAIQIGNRAHLYISIIPEALTKLPRIAEEDVLEIVRALIKDILQDRARWTAYSGEKNEVIVIEAARAVDPSWGYDELQAHDKQVAHVVATIITQNEALIWNVLESWNAAVQRSL